MPGVVSVCNVLGSRVSFLGRTRANVSGERPGRAGRTEAAPGDVGEGAHGKTGQHAVGATREASHAAVGRLDDSADVNRAVGNAAAFAGPEARREDRIHRAEHRRAAVQVRLGERAQNDRAVRRLPPGRAIVLGETSQCAVNGRGAESARSDTYQHGEKAAFGLPCKGGVGPVLLERRGRACVRRDCDARLLTV